MDGSLIALLRGIDFIALYLGLDETANSILTSRLAPAACMRTRDLGP